MSKKKSITILSIADLWRLSLSHWKWFVLSLVLCLGYAVYHLATTPKLYTRIASIMVLDEGPGNSVSENGKEFSDMGFVKQNNKMADVVRHIMSLDVLMDVVRRINPDLAPELILGAAEDIQDRLEAELEAKESSVINLTYRDYSIERAELVLSLIIQVHNENSFKQRRLMTEHTSQFIDSRLKLLEQDLGMVDDSIATFKSRNKITDITHVSDLYLKQQSESAADILKISNQKAMAGYIKSLLEDPTHHQLLLVNSGISNSAVEVQINQYNDLVLQLNSHLAYTSDQNPIIVNLENEIASLRKNILGTIDMHMQSLDIELMTLQGFNEDATAKIVSNPEQAKYLMAIERDQKVKESLYLYLLQKKEENEISLTYRAAKTQVIDLPHGSNSPTSPKRNQVLFAAFLLGLILPLGVIFLSYTLNESVRRISDIEQNCHLPILGEIPFSGSRIRIKRMITGAPGKNGIIVSPTGKDAGNEAFRMLRTHMEQPADGQSRVILVSSPGEGDGKTFAAMNLAAAFALGGKRVLLLDGDLRSTSASRLMKADDAIGLADLLVSGSEAYASCLVARDDVPGMDFLPAGRTDVNPAEMLASPALRQLIGLARNRYDVIVIDSPACEKTADADILEQYADEVLLIIRAGGYDRRELPGLEGRKKEGKNLSLILNIAHHHKY